MSGFQPVCKLLFPVVCAVGFFLGFESGSFQFILLRISKEFGLSNAVMGSLVSVQFLAMLICPLVVGRLSDKIAKKKIAAFFSFTFVVGCLLCAFSRNLTELVVGIFVLGGSYTTTQNATLAALADIYGNRSGKYVSIVQCLFSLGAVCGPILASFAILRLDADWRVVFYACGGAFLALFLLILLTGFESVAPGALLPGQAQHQPLKSIFSTTLLLLMVSILLYVAAENGFTYFLNTFFTTELDAPNLAATAISSFWIGAAMARMAGSFLHKHQRKMVLFCFSGSAVLIAIIALSTSALIAALLSFCLGFIFGPIWPYLISQANEEFPKYTGTVTSLMSISSSIGGAAIPVLVGATADFAGIRSSYFMLSGIALAAVFCYWIYYKRFIKNHRGV